MTTTEATAPPREQTRARYPDERATSSATASASSTRSTATASRRSSSAADVVDHPLAALEDADPLPRAPLPRGHVRRPRQRPLGPPAGAEAYDEREFAADALAVMDATGTERALIVGFSLGSQRGLILAADHPDRVDGAVFIGRASLGGGGHAAERRSRLRRRARHRRGLGEVQPPLLAARLPRLRRVLLLEGSSREPHSTKPIEDCVGWGLETDGETLDRDASAAPASRPRGDRARLCGRSLPGARDPRRRPTRLTPTRGARWPSRPAASSSTSRARAIARTRDPVKVNLLLRDFAAQPPAAADRWVRAASRAASARSTSPRRSASATRSATWRSRTSCASSTPISRSTGSRSIR